jgi:peptide deformylase
MARRKGTIRQIRYLGDPVLRTDCDPVTAFDADLQRLVDDMFVSMYDAPGVGLAANQIGISKRLFVYDCPDEDGIRHVGHIVNPVLELPEPGDRRLVDDTEGCLSVPGAAMEVPRTDRAVVRGSDKDGNPLVIEGTGYFARCLQHEADHLVGHTYLDRLSKRDRKDALRQMEERREDVFAHRARKAADLHPSPGPDQD